MTDRPDPFRAVGALADDARRRLYDHVCAQDHAVSRDEAAAGAGVPAHSARFHLDRLIEEGLLDTEFRRLTGRTGPGAGRPAKLYRRAAVEVSVMLPPRRYDLVGQVLAAAVQRHDDGLALHNCPFDALARNHTALVCGVNLDYVGGVVAGLGCTQTRAVLDPGPDRCCVRVEQTP